MSDKKTSQAVCQADQFFREINIEFLIHELKDPLSIIETAAIMLLDKQEITGVLTERQEKALRRILRSSRHARGMVYDLLEVGRAGAVCFMRSPFSLQGIFFKALLGVIEDRDVPLHERVANLSDFSTMIPVLAEGGIHVEVDENIPPLELVHDEIKFSQIISNLLKNAFSYRRTAVHIGLRSANGSILVSVGDDGPGIDPIHQETVFERYKQVAPEGLQRRGHGLGLAMSRILARSMGGDLTVSSGLEQGATFQLRLPIEAPETA